MIKASHLPFTHRYLHSPLHDLSFILLPPIFMSLIVFLFRHKIEVSSQEAFLVWLFIRAPFDSGHVFATLFKTYFDSDEFKKFKPFLICIPIGVFLFSFIFAYTNVAIFGQFVAYMAVFHFIRQQYGLVCLYENPESRNSSWFSVDYLLIHMSCLYPMIYWHANYPKHIQWFSPENFFKIPFFYEEFAKYFYIALIALYLFKEIYFALKGKKISLNKQLVHLGTALCWNLSIVYFDSILVFIILVEVSHAMPYLSLIWFHGKKVVQADRQKSFFKKIKFRYFFSGSAFLYLLLIFILGVGLDMMGFIFFSHPFAELRDHIPLFLITGEWKVALLLAAFTVIQFTHYILDGIIWKKKYT